LEFIFEILNKKILENPVKDILLFLIVLLTGILIKSFISGFISRIFFKVFEKRSSQFVHLTDFLTLLRTPVEGLLTLIILYISFNQLRFPPSWNLASVENIGVRLVVLKFYFILVTIAIARILLKFIDFSSIAFTRKSELTESTFDNQLVPFVRELAKVFLAIFIFLFILGSIFNLDVASIVAGLGIGGLAVALAAKESLENLFASFTIFLDKPFVAGDLVKVGDITGTIEKVGFRSTRIRTQDKSYLTLPNKMLIDQALDNLTQRRFRRARFTINLNYSTPSDNIKYIVKEIKKVLTEHNLTKSELSSVYFDEFKESYINIIIVFFVETFDWDIYMGVKEEINFKIIEIVHQAGANFASPTQNIIFHNDFLSATNKQK